MKTFTNNGTSAYDIVHMVGEKDDYNITENNGSLSYEGNNRKYIITDVEEMGFKNQNGIVKVKWAAEFAPFIDFSSEIDGGNWTVFASKSYNLTGDAASAGAVNVGTVGFDTSSIGSIDITNDTWTDLAAVGLNVDGSIKYWIAYTNISNTDKIKTELLDFSGETSSSTCQTTFGYAEIKTWDGSQIQTFTTDNAIFEIHHSNWDDTKSTNWILSEKARSGGSGLNNNWTITSHGRSSSINGIHYSIDDSIGESTILLYR